VLLSAVPVLEVHSVQRYVITSTTTFTEYHTITGARHFNYGHRWLHSHILCGAQEAQVTTDRLTRPSHLREGEVVKKGARTVLTGGRT
jgi:hypothetical protein